MCVSTDSSNVLTPNDLYNDNATNIEVTTIYTSIITTITTNDGAL